MKLEGSIRQFPLSDLISMILTNSATGVLEVGGPALIGQIFCRSGRIYHALAGEQDGVEAIRHMIEAYDVPFRFIGGVRHAAETLWPDAQMLIGFARRQEQLLRRVRPYIPSLDWVPVLCASNSRDGVRISATIWPVLAMIDGQCSVAEIAAALGHEPLEIGLTLSQLIARGLVNLKPPQRTTAQAPASPPSPPPARPNPPPAQPLAAAASGRHMAASEGESFGGFFEWLLTGRSEEMPAVWFFRPRALLDGLPAA
jgi:uncharacterized protein DUF4388